jgi:hypothetical protein
VEILPSQGESNQPKARIEAGKMARNAIRFFGRKRGLVRIAILSGGVAVTAMQKAKISESRDDLTRFRIFLLQPIRAK